ncbi:MAG: Trk system potassium transporter TrkA [Planctomycetota bacterium]|jgi:trk system potassium uptake protein TrkA|nr:Trk system potassium transporter TrkA [Planctomycetota bacterium]
MDFKREISLSAAHAAIIVGAGEVGVKIAERLVREGRQVVLVDRDQGKLLSARRLMDAQILVGGVGPEVLKRAGAAEAEILIAVTDNDEVNLIACLIANRLNPAATKVARVRNDEYATMPELGAPDTLNLAAMINPDAEVVDGLEKMIALPRAVDYGEFGGGRVKVIAVEILSGRLIGSPLAKLPELTEDRGLRIGGILRRERMRIPTAEETIAKGDVVYFVCLKETLPAVLALTDSVVPPIKRLFVVGGGDIGLRLAERLESRDFRIKLVDRDEKRAAKLAGKLKNAVVLFGDGTDRRFMREERLDETDMTIALTGDDETNILVCLLAKSLGCPNTITRVNKNAYMPIVLAIGLKLSVNPRLAAANSISRLLRRGLRLSSILTQDEDVEMLEGMIQPGSAFLGRPLRDLSVPAGINLLAAIREGEAFIPGGDTVLRAGDFLPLFASAAAWAG